ncbi:hypothetical protein QLQ12_37820 [Actinoplanes sp. NEAU-A12]|uniref:Transcriptional regulator n=1 Tax=Actinoplanes sandaracinus TaxID=3045177 RepID=A0ABT6WX96_9ACTN|nr:hypothetical protein [Actinoplanes sandaracinus]MDI6104365.1 hypothetical protein [Actinoplanes sandaracinus]
MDDDTRIEQALAVLARPGVYEVLHALYVRAGVATFAEIAAVVGQALSLLRALAAERLVFSYQCGSLDVEPHPQTGFMLTTKGEEVTAHMIRLQQWVAIRNARPGRHAR